MAIEIIPEKVCKTCGGIRWAIYNYIKNGWKNNRMECTHCRNEAVKRQANTEAGKLKRRNYEKSIAGKISKQKYEAKSETKKKRREYVKQYAKRNPEKVKSAAIKNQAKQREIISVSYIVRLIYLTHHTIPYSTIKTSLTPQDIEQYRESLKFKREYHGSKANRSAST